MLLNYLYPEMECQWIAIDKGTFYRNYNQDALSIDEKEKKVVLARDGFLRLLPDGLLTKNDDLRGEDFAAKNWNGVENFSMRHFHHSIPMCSSRN